MNDTRQLLLCEMRVIGIREGNMARMTGGGRGEVELEGTLTHFTMDDAILDNYKVGDRVWIQVLDGRPS